MAERLIIALGPGRCGSRSFVTLMNLQRGVEFYHEFGRLPWQVAEQKANRYLNAFAEYDGCRVLGDFGNWYVGYIKFIIERFDDRVKFIYLKRPKGDVVRSFLAKVVRGNHWTKEGSKFLTGEEKVSVFDECYPKYDAPKKEAIEQYYDDYELLVNEARINFQVLIEEFTLDVFSNTGEQDRLFDYLEIPEDDRHYCLNVVENKGYDLKSFIMRNG